MNMLIQFLWNQLWKSKGAGRLAWLLALAGVGASSWFGFNHLQHRFAHGEHRSPFVERQPEYRVVHNPEPASERRSGSVVPLHHSEERREEHGFHR
jgi:hypothetical protein